MHVSTGITIAFGTTTGFGTSFLGEVLDVTPPSISRGSVDVSYSGLATATPKAKEFLPTKLYEWGELSVTVGFDPSYDVEAIMEAAVETITLTFADSGAATWIFDGFVTNIEPEAPLEDKATATVTIKVTSDVVIST